MTFTPDELRNLYVSVRSHYKSLCSPLLDKEGNVVLGPVVYDGLTQKDLFRIEGDRQMAMLLGQMPLTYQKCLDPRWKLAADRTWLFDGIPEKDLVK